MKKLTCVVFSILFIFCSACTADKEKNSRNAESEPKKNAQNNEIEYGSMDMEWIDYFNVQNLLENMEMVFIGTITDISFQVEDMKTGGLLPTKDSKAEDIRLCTIYHIDVKTMYKGETISNVKLSCLGGLRDYKLEEQLALIKEYETYGGCINLVEDMPIYTIGKTYLFTVNQYANGTVANGNPHQCTYNLYNPFEEKYFVGNANTTAKDIISAFGKDKWDDFWTQWQKDNPDWEQRLDKEQVEKALAK